MTINDLLDDGWTLKNCAGQYTTRITKTFGAHLVELRHYDCWGMAKNSLETTVRHKDGTETTIYNYMLPRDLAEAVKTVDRLIEVADVAKSL